ncbi:thioredoxin family protein [Luteolibacter flavescens]|uniref:Thioredoxin family protein n=1 Tax=Luteolibacter flavescens TaxID=1859460 RepID=A0ABT3FJE5_9BACT|nr:thioredoxin family protein [Luteolibacter flavescens]MCW1883324.1 thioredoxin family protein [Luteolibacter flavescens]
MRWSRAFPVLSAFLLLPGCGLIGEKQGKPEMVGSPFGPTGVPPQLRGNQDGTAVKPGGNVSDEAARALATHDPDTLVWTDPDDADAPLPVLDTLLTAPKQKGPWWDSESEALRESKRSGKPLLIWFTDSVRSTACSSLSEKLLARPEFEAWASENTVRLVVDQSVKGKNIDDTTAKVLHSRDLKKKYKASGYPSLHVLAPSGEVIGRYKGYRSGQEDFIWGQLKQAVALAKERQESWKESLAKKGYRDWSNDSGKVIFAKLSAYRDGKMILVEPDGQRVRTNEKSLSAGDRVWIQQQKERRGIQ